MLLKYRHSWLHELSRSGLLTTLWSEKSDPLRSWPLTDVTELHLLFVPRLFLWAAWQEGEQQIVDRLTKS